MRQAHVYFMLDSDLYIFVQKLDQESVRFKHKICALYEGSELRTKQHRFSPKTVGILASGHILSYYYCAD